MGGQAIACTSGSSSTVDRAISICPAGWRVPTRPQQQSLLTTLGVGGNSAGSVIFRRDFLEQYNGYWYLEPLGYGTEGSYWSSTISASTDIYVSDVTPSGAYAGYAFNKQNCLGLRCIIN